MIEDRTDLVRPELFVTQIALSNLRIENWLVFLELLQAQLAELTAMSR
jgi:hypothetical protein